MEQQTAPIYLRFGGAEKHTSEMTDEELTQTATSILKRAKEKAFSKGRPIIYSEGGKTFAEWPDGHIEEIKKED